MEESKREERVIGLDMHPDSFTATALKGSNAQTAEVQWTHSYCPEDQLERWLERYVTERDIIVIEASGNTFHTVDRIRRAGRHAVVLEAVRASQIRKAYCTTDKTSSVKLARVYMSGLAREVWTPDETTRERREVLYAHRGAVADATRARNRIRAWMNGFGIRRRKGLKLAHEDGEKWVMDQREWSQNQKLLIGQMFSSLREAEARRKQLRQLMAEEVGANKDMLKLLRLFGLNAIGAYALWAAIGDIYRFRTPKKLVAYLGMTPRIHRSGLGQHDGGTARWGNTEVRRILMQGAHALLRSGDMNKLHRWGLKLKVKRGHNYAVFAVARKIVVAVWYLARGFGGPLEEATLHIRRKLEGLGTTIGSDRVRELGYKDTGDFRDQRITLLMQEA